MRVMVSTSRITNNMLDGAWLLESEATSHVVNGFNNLNIGALY